MVCPKCLISKPTADFYLRKRGPRAGKYYEKCKLCMKIRGRAYYHANRERQLFLALRRRKNDYYEKRAILNKIKNVPCKDCGRSFPYYVMDFDHRHGTGKLKDISHTISWSIDRIIRETEKCDVVCANCHRIRTYGKICHAEIAKSVKALV